MKVRSGSFIAEDESRNTIQEKQSLVVRKIGRVPVTKMDINISQQTINNYLAMIVNQQGVSIYTSIATKAKRRFTAENSLISSMVLLYIIACTHYYISTEFQ